MFNNSSKIMFMLILLMGTLISVSSNNWLSAWMGLEINLLSFIPLMKDNNLMSTEASLKYFLTQALASAVLLFAVIMMFMSNNYMMQDNMLPYYELIIMSSLLLKMGAAPFHFWFPNVMEGLTWINNLILMTWQKIAPMMLISYVMNQTVLMGTVILSTIIGSLGGLNQTSLRKLMAFSSINHLGWMLMAMQINEMTWLMYFMFYFLLTFTIISMFNMMKLYHMNQLFNVFFNSKVVKFILFMNLLSLGGLPPFIGFIPKWLVIQTMVMTNQYMMLIIMMITALITLYFYIRLCFAAFMFNYYENNWTMQMQSKNMPNMYFSMTTSFISIFGMIIISMIYTIL